MRILQLAPLLALVTPSSAASLPCFFTNPSEDCLRSLGGIPPSLSPAWISFQLNVPQLPNFYVAGNRTRCSDLANVSAPDPYHRAAGKDPAVQTLKFCEAIETLRGPLDGWALLTCDPGRGQWNTLLGPLNNPTPRGALWLYHYVDPQARPQIVPFDGFPEGQDFKPLGSGTILLPDGSLRTFVANAAGERSFIEVFTLINVGGTWRARHVRSISHPLATHTPNAIAPLSASEFLVTQDHLFSLRAPPQEQLQATLEGVYPQSSGFAAAASAALFRTPLVTNTLPQLETVVAPALTWVAHVNFSDAARTAQDQVGARIVARNIIQANGIALSPGGSTIAVASSQAPAVLFYNAKRGRQWYDGQLLEERARVYTPFIVDNIGFSKRPAGAPVVRGSPVNLDGADVVAAGHPSGLKLMDAAKDPENQSIAPSWAARISFTGVRNGDVDSSAPVPASRHSVEANTNGFEVRTVYQGTGLTAPEVGVQSSTTTVWDQRRGIMITTGLYGDPGAMVCRSFSIE